MAQKDLVTEYAMDVEGVNNVKNEMKVASTPVKTTPQVITLKVDTVGDTIR